MGKTLMRNVVGDYCSNSTSQRKPRLQHLGNQLKEYHSFFREPTQGAPTLAPSSNSMIYNKHISDTKVISLLQKNFVIYENLSTGSPLSNSLPVLCLPSHCCNLISCCKSLSTAPLPVLPLILLCQFFSLPVLLPFYHIATIHHQSSSLSQFSAI